MERCFNCKKQQKPGSLFVKGGATFYVCDQCDPNLICDSKINQNAESWVSRNIREAKERRASGLSPWNNTADIVVRN